MRAGHDIQQPIYILGTGRSGTTLTFEVLATHPHLAWFSQYTNRFPRLPCVSLLSRLPDISPAFRKSIERSDQGRHWIERLRVGPVEAYDLYEHCCGEKFRRDYLLGVSASDAERECLRKAVSNCLRYQGKTRFAAKITGPGRINYLSSIFEDVIFLNVIRDGRAVVQSLLRVPFWRDSEAMTQPAWRNGLTEEELESWRRHDRSPVALAAIQWRACIERTRQEADALEPHRYAELRYEDLVRHPHSATDQILAFFKLEPAPVVHEFLSSRFDVRDMNHQWRDTFSEGEVRMLESLLGDTLNELGYLESVSGTPAPENLIRSRLERSR